MKVIFHNGSGVPIESDLPQRTTKLELIKLAENLGAEKVELPHPKKANFSTCFKRLHKGINGRRVDSWSSNYGAWKQHA